MIYAKTQVAPPEEPEQSNLYDDNINMELKKFTQTGCKDDATYDKLINRVVIFSAEKKLKPQEGDTKMRQIISVYSPVFLYTCFNKFDQPSWNTADHAWMQGRISRIKAARLSTGASALNKSTLDSLNLVESVINDYRQASLISQANFTNWSTARSHIAKANEYAQNKYLSKNTSLVSALGSVRERLANSSWANLTNMVEKLRAYHSYSQYDYENVLVPKVEAAIRDYENNAPSTFGSARSTDQLWNLANSLFRDAQSYYRPNSNNNFSW